MRLELPPSFIPCFPLCISASLGPLPGHRTTRRRGGRAKHVFLESGFNDLQLSAPAQGSTTARFSSVHSLVGEFFLYRPSPFQLPGPHGKMPPQQPPLNRHNCCPPILRFRALLRFLIAASSDARFVLSSSKVLTMPNQPECVLPALGSLM